MQFMLLKIGAVPLYEPLNIPETLWVNILHVMWTKDKSHIAENEVCIVW